VRSTIDHFGRLDVLVNNAGILRDRMLVNMSEQEWDAVIQVHLKGTFAPLRHAAAYWREEHKAGRPVDARVINTTSSSGIYGNAGQSNYGAAKAGIAAMTVITAMELGRYGVTVNAVAPAALTRMTENLRPDREKPDPNAFDPSAADNIAPLVVWLAGPAARDVTGRVFNVRGGMISVAEGWQAGPGVDKGERWTVEELDDVLPGLVAKAAPNADQRGVRPAAG
jgi:NAD(P)-dependent dehydrogenase (short-subunit alcohol dehydrogenase family)